MSVIHFPDIYRDTKTVDRQATYLNGTIGWVYILSNEFMPGLLKIGFTTALPSIRCEELSRATGVPQKFVVEDGLYCVEARKVEAEVHKILSECRVNRSREFFRCSVRDAMCALWTAQIEMSEHIEAVWPGAEGRQMKMFGRPVGGGRILQGVGMEL